jgi:predicted type IV restriction endonuclease
MPNIPKKVVNRFNRLVLKFQKILEIAKAKDVNESDTVAIITDIFADVFGYDKYLEITSEFAVRSTYCDLAVKLDEKVQFLIEVKAIGKSIKEKHLRQAVEYGANHGIPWIIVTNGVEWNLYKIKFERPIDYDKVCSFDFLKLDPKKEKVQETLFLLSREGLKKEARDEFYSKVQSVNKFVVGAIILSDTIVGKLRSRLRKLSPGIRVELSEIETLLRNEVLKRDIIDGDESRKAYTLVQHLQKKRIRRTTMPETITGTAVEPKDTLPNSSQKKYKV